MAQDKILFRAFLFALAASALTLATVFWLNNRERTYGGDFNLNFKNTNWKFSINPKQLNLIYFGYAKCPDVCPMTLTYTGQAFRKLTSEELKNVRFIFVSVDYEHDNPNDVADYAHNFFPEFIGLSGSQQQIDSTINLFPATYAVEKNENSFLGYSIMPTDRIFFLTKRGISIDSVPGTSFELKPGGKI